MNIIEKLLKNGTEIRALSCKQPYAELMLHGKIETRSWYTKYRGLVLICVSKKSYSTEQLRNISGGNQLWRMGEFLDIENPKYEGKAIAIGVLIDCRTMKPEDEDKCFVRYYPDLWCHEYIHVTPIVPFEWKGSRKWGKVGEDIISSIKFLA